MDVQIYLSFHIRDLILLWIGTAGKSASVMTKAPNFMLLGILHYALQNSKLYRSI